MEEIQEKCIREGIELDFNVKESDMNVMQMETILNTIQKGVDEMNKDVTNLTDISTIELDKIIQDLKIQFVMSATLIND